MALYPASKSPEIIFHWQWQLKTNYPYATSFHTSKMQKLLWTMLSRQLRILQIDIKAWSLKLRQSWPCGGSKLVIYFSSPLPPTLHSPLRHPILIQVKSDIQELALPVVAILNLSSNKLKQLAVSPPHASLFPSFDLETGREKCKKDRERRMLLWLQLETEEIQVTSYNCHYNM